MLYEVITIAIRKILKEKPVIIPGFMNRFNAFFIRLVPENFRIFVGTRIFKREKKKTHESNANRGEQPAWQQPEQKTTAS